MIIVLKKIYIGNYFFKIFNWFDKLIIFYENKYFVLLYIIILIKKYNFIYMYLLFFVLSLFLKGVVKFIFRDC